MSDKMIIGVDIGGTKISSGLVDFNGLIKDVTTVPTLANEPAENTLKQFKLSIDKLLDKYGLLISDIEGIGVCCPGPLNPKTGDIINPPNLPAFWHKNLKTIITSIYPLPVKIENDANAAGLAETLIGAAKNFENVLYVTVSTGVGTGIIINREIYHGKNGFAGEGGHLSANYKGNVDCNCKTPCCIESIASGTAIAKYAREFVSNGERPDSMLNTFKDSIEEINAKEVGQCALKGDKLAVEIIENSAFNIGAWLGGMINLLDPDIIVIGGGVSLIGELFFNKVRATALQYTYNMNADKTPIVPAQLQTNVGIYGAASLFLD